jgi:DNA repair exonuclease SbcCD ATPase subunit
MLNLKKMWLKGIGRFVEQQEICFDRLGNLVQVDGENRNTGGSSASAKTTIFNAHDFVLGLNTIPNSMLQSRLTDEPILVEEEYDYDGVPLIISRGKKLKITLNGEVTTGSAKVTEEKLDQILGMPRDLFRLMQHKKQGEKGFFLNFTPAEINKFLMDGIGLGSFKNDLEKLDEKAADLSKMITSTRSILEAHYSGLKATEDAITALGPAPTKDVDQAAILDVKRKAELAKEELEALLMSQKLEEVKFLDSKPTDLEWVAFDESELGRHDRTVREIESKMSDLKLNEKGRLDDLKNRRRDLYSIVQAADIAKKEALRLAAEVSNIRGSVCPRCEQPWSGDYAKADEIKTLERISALKGTVAGGEVAKAAMEMMDQEIKSNTEVSHEMSSLKEQWFTAKSAYDGEKARKIIYEEEQRSANLTYRSQRSVDHRALLDRQAREASQLVGQESIYRKSFEMAVLNLKNYSENSARYEKSLKILQAQKESYCQQVLVTNHNLVEAEKNLETAEELKRGVKSYLSCSFDDALETISENATKMIQSIPNMATATIQLVGTKETKEGKVKEEVTAIIHMDGEENIPIKTLSGGERASADIAIDLAALALIEDRTNKGINIFILDEPFTGLDSANIEMVLEVLKNASTHKKLIIVDHNPLVKEQISDRIIAVRDGLTSTITQN